MLFSGTGRLAMSEMPEAARYLVTSSQPISLKQSLALAQKIHLALVEHSNGSCTFTGCDSSRQPIKGHGHAYIFCESNNREPPRDDKGVGDIRGVRRDITHITVFCPNGFGPAEKAALQKLTHVYGGDIPDVRLSLLFLGQAKSIGGTDLDQGQCPILASSRCWVSRLPFLPARHPKVTRAGAIKRDSTGLQIDCPEHELLRLLSLSGFPGPVEVERVDCTELGESEEGIACWTGWNSFVRARRDFGQDRSPRLRHPGYGFRLRFSENVQGPLALGYASHFGMGLFVPEDEQVRQQVRQQHRQRDRSGSLIARAAETCSSKDDCTRTIQKGDMQICLIEAGIKFVTSAHISLWSARGFQAAIGQKLQDRICALFIAQKKEIRELPQEKTQEKPQEYPQERLQEKPQDENHQPPHSKRRHFRCKKNCELSGRCSYGQMFLPPESWAALADLKAPIKKLAPPLPLVLTPMQCGDFHPEDGSDCAFVGLCLIGSARENLAYLLLALKDLGESGIGNDSQLGAGRFVLQSAESITPRRRDPVYSDSILQRDIASFSYHDLLDESEELKGSVSLQFLTPTLIGDSTGYTCRPAMRSLLFHLQARANQLSSSFGTGLLYLPSEYSKILSDAEKVKLKSAIVTEIHSGNRLNPSKASMSLGDGSRDKSSDESPWQQPPYFTGEIIYEGTFSKDMMALLTLGQIIHVGEGAGAGNGLFHVEANTGTPCPN